NPAKFISDFVITQENCIIYGRLLPFHVEALGLHPRLDDLLAFVIHRYAQNDKSLGPVFVIELDKPGDLRFARLAPSGPEVYEYDLAFVLIHAGGRALECGNW